MRQIPDPLLVANLTRHVDCLAGLIGPRPFSNQPAFSAAATYVENELTKAGHNVSRHIYTIDNRDVANLIAEVPGGRRKDEIVILGAHYDTVPPTPGADDNASAVAVLIEVARLLNNWKPSRTVRFVSFACEEPPHCYTDDMGSRAYAQQCRARGERIVGMLCLEMVGYYTTDRNSQKIPPGIPRTIRWAFPKRGDFLAAVGNLQSWKLNWQFRRGFKRAVRFPLFSICLPESINEIRRSDNSSFWDHGYPALMLTDTSFLRNPNYHLTTDTPDTLDYHRMAQVTLGVAGAVRRIAG